MAEPMTDLEPLYSQHLASLQQRFGAALEASALDAALVYSGPLFTAIS